jgi:catechol 2,3-dioxygenase-like lactoylglutathione lyase family enzyme
MPRLRLGALGGPRGRSRPGTSLADPIDKPHGQRVAYVRDPFGTLIEIASPL